MFGVLEDGSVGKFLTCISISADVCNPYRCCSKVRYMGHGQILFLAAKTIHPSRVAVVEIRRGKTGTVATLVNTGYFHEYQPHIFGGLGMAIEKSQQRISTQTCL